MQPDDEVTRCWVVDCKTPNCGVLVLAVIGPPEPSRIPVFPGCEEFELTCDGCQDLHKYCQTDIRWQNVANLPSGYRPKECKAGFITGREICNILPANIRLTVFVKILAPITRQLELFAARKHRMRDGS